MGIAAPIKIAPAGFFQPEAETPCRKWNISPSPHRIESGFTTEDTEDTEGKTEKERNSEGSKAKN